jgi:hypothetical protein
MKSFFYLICWTLANAGLAMLIWRVVHHHAKVYILIGWSWFYLSGTFVLFSLATRGKIV